MIYIVFLLISAHYLCDFPLQSDVIAINKNKNSHTELQKQVPWGFWLLAHALTHGLAVALITQSGILGIAETTAHFTIDYFKCEKKYGIYTDQALHIVCKLVWIAIRIFFPSIA